MADNLNFNILRPLRAPSENFVHQNQTHFIVELVSHKTRKITLIIAYCKICGKFHHILSCTEGVWLSNKAPQFMPIHLKNIHPLWNAHSKSFTGGGWILNRTLIHHRWDGNVTVKMLHLWHTPYVITIFATFEIYTSW